MDRFAEKYIGTIAGHGLQFTIGNAYSPGTTKLLEKALGAVRQLPPSGQDEIALAMLTLSGQDSEPQEVDAAYLPAILEGLASGQASRVSTDDEIEAAFRRFER